MRIMSFMDCAVRPEGARIVALYEKWTMDWHEHSCVPPDASVSVSKPNDLEVELRELHAANFALWHEEDKARDPSASDAEISAAKRTIDRVNQLRNDQMERCDTILLQSLAQAGLLNPDAEPHSETPGLMMDRLSILSLKHYHTREELARAGAPRGHAERNLDRLRILTLQRDELAANLDRLWRRVLDGERTFRVYRQLKMYNDPDLNPVLYRTSAQ
ncbi:MAG TPA: DUF4254 domain-containing protein [Acidobacteriaceae bacterium]|nr:DUF4254 domain-containing protein [Acidobacteriaceae bacterium]